MGNGGANQSRDIATIGCLASFHYIYYSGLYANGDLDVVLRYDVIGDSWTTMPSLTTARGGARMWVYEGLLAVGGGGWSSYLNTVEEYDLSTGTGGTRRQ